MVQTVKDSFLDLERHRQLLEENIEKLRKSLRHWQTWEAEYEGLKEEILALSPPPNREQLLTISREYGGELVTKKEIEEILGLNTSRTAAQVVNLLDRRIDYVEQNVRTVQKQINTGEHKLAAATVISTPDARNEDGLPLTEIMEELDDEGNVISSRLSTPGSSKPQLLEVLKKAGVEGLPGSEAAPTPAVGILSKPEEKTVKTSQVAKSTKKGVKFAEDTKPGPEQEKSQTAKRIEEIVNLARQQAKPPSEPPVIPNNESFEDAALRRDMLQYGLTEVGAVVAELDLEDGSDWSNENYEDDETSDEEDEFGRSTGRLVDDELRQQMIELEQRLGIRMMENIGNKASDYDIVREGIGRVSINGQAGNTAPKRILASPSEEQAKPQDDANDLLKAKSTKQKSVKFSGDLDIAPVSNPPAAPTPTTSRPKVAPVSDIVERSAPARAAFTTMPQKKVSKFRSSRAAGPASLNGPLAPNSISHSGPSLPLHPAKPSTPKPFSTLIQFSTADDNIRTVPAGPEGQILSPSIIERDIPLSTSIPEPDELDPNLLNQEVATEYHKMRNRTIQRQGGFLREEESEIVPFSEEEGGARKMSRFKAARLARS